MGRCGFYSRTACHRIELNGIHLNVVYIIKLLLFSFVNIFAFEYNICEDISNDASVYLSNCGSTVETASTHICFCSIFRLYPVKNRDIIEKQNFKRSVL